MYLCLYDYIDDLELTLMGILESEGFKIVDDPKVLLIQCPHLCIEYILNEPFIAGGAMKSIRKKYNIDFSYRPISV
jgi:hypothetical protein